MLRFLIDFSLRRRFVALSLTALMAIGGVMAFRSLPVNSLPDVTPVQVLVITKAGRYAPPDVERLVSFPVETVMNGLPGVKEVRSTSQFGLSAVTVEFHESTDIYFARQLVAERVQAVAGSLPPGVDPPQLGPISTALGEIYQYTVRGEGWSLTDLRTLHDWLIAPQLKTVQGVTEVNSFGGFVKQYEVQPDPVAMQQYGITLETLMEALDLANETAGGNFIEHNREQYIIRGVGTLTSVEDIERVNVVQRGGRPILVRDVATVHLGQALRQGAVTQDGNGEVVTGIVMMLRGGNGQEVIAAVEERMALIRPGLPTGVTIEKFYDQSDLIKRTTFTLAENLVLGGFLVIVVLLALLGEWRGALIVASVIPLSILFAFMGMRGFGLAANLMSLGAVDFGMVVDGAVVMIDNIVKRLRPLGPEVSTRKRLTVLRDAAQEVARPVFFGVLIILIVYLPIATFSGMEGLLYRPMAITVASAVFGSLLLALIFVPAVASLAFRKGVRVRESKVFVRLQATYQKQLERRLAQVVPIVGGAALLFAISLGVLSQMGTEFLPELDEGAVLIEVVRPPGVTLDESVAKGDTLARRLLAHLPEIRTVIPKTGRSDLANDWMGIHQTDVWVLLHPPSTWRRGMTRERLESEMATLMADDLSMVYNFTQPIAMRVDELTSGVKSDLAVKVFGENLDEVHAVTHRIATRVNTLPGTENVLLDQPEGQPYATFALNREAIARYGLTVRDVQRTIEAGLGGQPVGQVFEEQRRFDLVVRYAEPIRSTLLQLAEVPLVLPDGGSIPLGNVATLTLEEGPREIARENGWRRSVVGINLSGIDMGTYVENLQVVLREPGMVPEGIFVQIGGAFEDQQRATAHLILVVPMALALIFGLLYLQFGKARYAGLVFLNLPLAMTGGIFLLWGRGMYLSVSASIGFVALFGVAVLNGIVLIEHLNHLRREGVPLKEAVLKGTTDRLRPVLMTALVASLGFVPMAFNTGPGSEVQRPLATVVIGGLISATLLTLLVLPVLYYAIERDEHVPPDPEAHVFDASALETP